MTRLTEKDFIFIDQSLELIKKFCVNDRGIIIGTAASMLAQSLTQKEIGEVKSSYTKGRLSLKDLIKVRHLIFEDVLWKNMF